MNTLLEDVPVDGREAHDQYVATHGRSGAVGVFTTEIPIRLRRGARVLVHTARGLELGEVLGPATIRQARLLGAASSGTLVRAATDDDEAQRAAHRLVEDALFEAGRVLAEREGLALEIIDIELLFDTQVAIVQFVGEDANTEKFARNLEDQFRLAIRLENLALPTPADEEKHHCDKPDCGRESGGGCTTCGTGGGCSSCGSAKVDMRQYFGHLRTKMEANNRIPLA